MSKIFHKKLFIFKLLNQLHAFMKIKVSVLYSPISPIDPICDLINTAHSISHYSLKVNFIFSHIYKFSEWPWPFMFSKLNFQYLYFPVSIMYTSHHMLLALIFLIMFARSMTYEVSSSFSFLKSPLTSCLLRTNRFQTSLFYIYTFTLRTYTLITRKAMYNFRLPPQSA